MSVSELAGDYFDGRSARPVKALASLTPQGLQLRGDTLDRVVPLSQVQWPERTRHGQRIVHVADGASFQAYDPAAFDAWRAGHGHRGSLVERAQQSWRGVLVAVALLAVLAGALYQWGLPAAARGVLSFVPASVDQRLGESALHTLGGQILEPSTLPMVQQEALKRAFDGAVAAAYPAGQAPAYRVHFHKSRIGPNAFALPGGIIVMTDELVKLVEGDVEVVVGVLAHELGHVEHRHGMRMVVQTGLLGVITSVAFGDFSGWLAAAPVILGQAAYSRAAEREADVTSIRILRAAGLSPLAMVRFFEKIGAKEGGRDRSLLGIAFASHPADAERIAVFREAAR
ncbi:M48 family metallopeptidase [Caldimonas caldifontis]|nr:M48 family metallopeptidase [Caldimonas caldifontis]